MTSWKDRIVEIKQMRVGELSANPHNAKIHTKKQKDALTQSLKMIGKAGVLMAYPSDRHGGRLVLWDGHARQELNPDEVWYVAITNMTDQEADQLLLTYDPIAAMAEWDKELAKSLIDMTSHLDSALAEMVLDIASDAGIVAEGEEDDRYTDLVTAPIYEPTGEVLPPSQLYNAEKYHTLIKAVSSADIPSDVREFLQMAATRHIKFNYESVANYYASAPSHIQNLMESSALVVIDYEDAVKNGFVVLSKTIKDIVYG